MPTSVEFGLASEKFAAAAGQVGDLAAAAQGLDPGSVLLGGSVGSEVPAKVAQASGVASRCQGILNAAAATCRLRATIMAAYEDALRVFDGELANYVAAWRVYDADLVQHAANDDVAEPAKPTVAMPVKPTTPSWSSDRSYQ